MFTEVVIQHVHVRERESAPAGEKETGLRIPAGVLSALQLTSQLNRTQDSAKCVPAKSMWPFEFIGTKCCLMVSLSFCKQIHAH